MINHHPGDELLLALAAGRLSSGESLLVAVHLESCNDCRSRLHTLQALGGELLEEADPQLLAPDALARTLERIEAQPLPPAPAAAAREAAHPELPEGVPWPASLRGCKVTPWRWMGPGMRFSRVQLPHEPDASIFLLRIAPGKSLARHTHRKLELTQVLCGTFDDGRDVFGPGDFDATDPDVLHQPVVRPGAVCVCLAYVEAGLKYEGRIASLIGGWVGM